MLPLTEIHEMWGVTVIQQVGPECKQQLPLYEVPCMGQSIFEKLFSICAILKRIAHKVVISNTPNPLLQKVYHFSFLQQIDSFYF